MSFFSARRSSDKTCGERVHVNFGLVIWVVNVYDFVGLLIVAKANMYKSMTRNIKTFPNKSNQYVSCKPLSNMD